MRCLGIYRELQNSPNRESDDALILEAVIGELAKLGHTTKLIAPEAVDSVDPSQWDAIVPMCESFSALRTVLSWEAAGGPMLINPPSSIRNCYRIEMVKRLSAALKDAFPISEIRPVSRKDGAAPGFLNGQGAWVKRGDVHNTCDHDVVYIKDWAAYAPVREDFQSREITDAVFQPHLPGDLIKFYGVGPGRWFTWFYHNPKRALNIPFELAKLQDLTSKAAAAVELEVFGGDAIIGEDSIHVIDINSWPSFARVRDEAKGQIAAHIHARFERAAKEQEQETLSR